MIIKILRESMRAIGKARLPIISVGVIYGLSVATGIIMASSGNSYALDRRDAIVSAAQSSDTLIAYKSGDKVRAALLDTAANLGLGGLTSTVLGITVIGSYPLIVYRGWVGGIVSVDSQHHSRLAAPDTALYYLITLILQLIPYSIAGGVGIYLGLGAWQDRHGSPRPSLLGLRRDRIRDAALSYVLIIPLFLVASLWEFLV